ncbi:hypothetical protein HanRHA438_Chr14g0668911 [Helianthus annuus]|nr:hypothetical protein HanRHA438_Chr14g0668911 [Helianthus annuus]
MIRKKYRNGPCSRTYIKILSGRLRSLKLSAKALTDLRDERSSSRTSILAFLWFSRMTCLA